jgi:hypothetical protein
MTRCATEGRWCFDGVIDDGDVPGVVILAVAVLVLVAVAVLVVVLWRDVVGGSRGRQQPSRRGSPKRGAAAVERGAAELPLIVARAG